MKEAILKLQTYKLFEDGELLVCRDDVLRALEQEPCKDKITEWKKDFKEYVNALSMPRDDYKGIMEYIDELPATSEPCKDTKTGYWINGKCTKCGNYAPFNFALLRYYPSEFCPHCGAKMEEEVER